MLEQNYQKTEAGRSEIKTRALALSRSSRNLLLLLDASRPARDWLTLVQGATAADLAYLLEQGLIASTTAAATTAAASPTASTPSLDYEQLYSYLTRHAKQYLGLMKGYRLVLDVERCADLAALQVLAEHFLADVQQAQGDAVAEQVRQALGFNKR